jgi:hypothetical protein
LKTDFEFLSALNNSAKYVSLVASWMAKGNCDVVIKPTLIRPDFDSRNDFLDSGDIEIRQRVEVKQRCLRFTSVDDYPYSTVIVDEKHKIDRIPNGRLWGYVIVNQECTHACLVKPNTREYWQTKETFDKKDNQNRCFYVCPKELCFFCEID